MFPNGALILPAYHTFLTYAGRKDTPLRNVRHPHGINGSRRANIRLRGQPKIPRYRPGVQANRASSGGAHPRTVYRKKHDPEPFLEPHIYSRDAVNVVLVAYVP